VRDRPKHGYQVALDVSERSGGLFTFQHGTLYPILHRLEKAGLLSGAWSDGTGRRRKVYRLTPDGRKRLEAEGERMTRILEVLRRLLDPKTGP
jgi:DNA-binding PadR family transcriptional regulator